MATEVQAVPVPDAEAEEEEEDVKPNVEELEKALKGEDAPEAPKLVVNPAAMLIMTEMEKSKSSVSDESLPNYQTNREITPRTRGSTEKSGKTRSVKEDENKPAFSTKVFALPDIGSEPEGMVGVEYVVKIVEKGATTMYECSLCEMEAHGDGMQAHLTSHNHRTKFLQKHFPTAIKPFKDFSKDPKMETVLGRIYDKLAKAIEAHHGRELPYECDKDEYTSNRYEVMSKVYSFRHASEYSGPSFLDVMNKATVDKFVAEMSTYRCPRREEKRKLTFDPPPDERKKRRVSEARDEHKKRAADHEERERSRETREHRAPYSSRLPYRRPEYTDRYRAVDRDRDRLPRPRTDRGRPPLCVLDAIPPQHLDVDQHKMLVEQFLANTIIKPRSRARSRSKSRSRDRDRERDRDRDRDRDRERERRRREPSISPLREGDVWQAYRHMFDRHIVGLEEEYKTYRKDPEKHPNYNAEWQSFWKKRKDDLVAMGVDHATHDFQPEWVVYFGVRIKELQREAVEDLKVKLRERLVLPLHNDALRDERFRKYRLKQTKAIESPTQVEERVEVSVLSVLRLLTALEDDLGSTLGPRIVDLMGKALTVEKIMPSNVDEAILTLENCTLLETVRERLKGLQIAGMLEGPKLRAIKRVVEDIKTLVDKVSVNRIALPAVVSYPVNPLLKPAPKPMAAPKRPQDSLSEQLLKSATQIGSPPAAAVGIGATAAASAVVPSKKDLAIRLAAGLAAKGKTNVQQAKLEEIVSVYAALEKRGQGNDKMQKSLSDTLAALVESASPPPEPQPAPLPKPAPVSVPTKSWPQSLPQSNQTQMDLLDHLSVRSGNANFQSSNFNARATQRPQGGGQFNNSANNSFNSQTARPMAQMGQDRFTNFNASSSNLMSISQMMGNNGSNMWGSNSSSLLGSVGGGGGGGGGSIGGSSVGRGGGFGNNQNFQMGGNMRNMMDQNQAGNRMMGGNAGISGNAGNSGNEIFGRRSDDNNFNRGNFNRQNFSQPQQQNQNQRFGGNNPQNFRNQPNNNSNNMQFGGNFNSQQQQQQLMQQNNLSRGQQQQVQQQNQFRQGFNQQQQANNFLNAKQNHNPNANQNMNSQFFIGGSSGFGAGGPGSGGGGMGGQGQNKRQQGNHFSRNNNN